MSQLRIVLARIVASVVIIFTTQALGDNRCIGTFSDMSMDNASGDASGLKFQVRPPENVIVTIYEGSVSSVRGRNVTISDQSIYFDYDASNHFSGKCGQSGITGPGFNHQSGKMESKHFLKRLK